MPRNLLVILAFMAIGYTGCKQVEYVAPPPANPGSYFPQTQGSTWTYRDSVFGETSDTVNIHGPIVNSKTYTINGATTDFNGLICYNAATLSSDNTVGTAYYSYDKHIFALLESTPPWGLTILDVMVDTAKMGHVWVSDPSLTTLLNGSPVQVINTIAGTGVTKTVNGVTYTNVTHTASNFQINVGGDGFHNVANFDFYLAPGVGLIEKDAYYYGLLNESETLESYSISKVEK
jgi:hypothetical protein